MKTAEGAVEYTAPQIAGRDEAFRSEIRPRLKGRSEALEDLAAEMPARGLSARGTGDAFRADDGSLLLSRTAVSEIGERLWEDCQAPSRAIARGLGADLVRKWEKEFPSAAACFQDGFEACVAHLRMPVRHRKAIRTTNMLERLFGGERRRLKVIPNAWGEKAVLKLMFAAMARASERWRPIAVTGFERRQLDQIRKDLDEEYEKANGPLSSPKTERAPPNYPAESGLDLTAPAEAARCVCRLLPGPPSAFPLLQEGRLPRLSFEACSAFTHVPACAAAEPPKAAL